MKLETYIPMKLEAYIRMKLEAYIPMKLETYIRMKLEAYIPMKHMGICVACEFDDMFSGFNIARKATWLTRKS